MITIQLKGGIGNQLYQIAAVYAHAKKNNLKFVMNYKLEFGAMQGNHPKIYKDSFYKNFESVDQSFNIACREPSYKYKELPFLGIEHDVVYDGYFQSWKYFKDVDREEIRKLFNFTNTKRGTRAIESLRNHLGVDKIVGVHIRRGDYFKNPNIFNIVKADYYNKAKENFNPKTTAFIYTTDDIHTVKREFKFDSHNVLANGRDELEDLYLLSQCDSLIMANSSFSAWAGYLGKEKETIYYPKKWFGKDGPPTDDLIDPNWIGL